MLWCSHVAGYTDHVIIAVSEARPSVTSPESQVILAFILLHLQVHGHAILVGLPDEISSGIEYHGSRMCY